MSESRAALLARHRMALRARVARVAELFEGTGEDRTDAAAESERAAALAELHTLKGEARLLGLSALAAVAHDLESRAAELGLALGSSEALAPLRQALDEGVSDAAPAPGKRDALVGLSELLRELARHARVLAEQNGKAVRVEVSAEGVELERAALDQLWPALLHLVENAIDHGLEPPHERGDKPLTGRIALCAEMRGSGLFVSVEDDGRGIDPETIRAAAVTHELCSASRAQQLDEGELFELLFEQGLSTRAEVSLLSGRGVGLDAARRRVRSLRGQIAIESEVGRGTRFTLSLPSTTRAISED